MSTTIAAGEFKAKCLKLLDQVAEKRETLVITKHGKPVAQLGADPGEGEPCRFDAGQRAMGWATSSLRLMWSGRR